MKKIIVQDNDPDILDILTFALKEAGFMVMPTAGCENVMESIHEFRPHVVILDYKLSGKECLDAYKQIRKKYPHLPVLALSCNSDIHEVYSAYGFDGYIKKPFDLDELYSILRRHIHQPDLGPGVKQTHIQKATSLIP